MGGNQNDEKTQKIPRSVYDFDDRLASMKKVIEKCFQEIIRLGFDKRKAYFSFFRVASEKHTAHIRFHPEIMKRIWDARNHADIRNDHKILEKGKRNPDSKILIINKKDVVIFGERGLSILEKMLKRACQSLKGGLKKITNEKAESIQLCKSRLCREAGKLLAVYPEPEKINIFYKKGFYTIAIIFYRKRKRGQAWKRKFPPNFISSISISAKCDIIIDKLKELLKNTCFTQEDAK